MRRRDVLVGAGMGAVAALIVAPLAELGVRSATGGINALNVFAGALLATIFFGVSALTAAIFQNSQNLRTAILMTYACKTALVFAALQTVQLNKSDAITFGVSIIVSGVAYLVFQTLYIARWRKPYRHRHSLIRRLGGSAGRRTASGDQRSATQKTGTLRA